MRPAVSVAALAAASALLLGCVASAPPSEGASPAADAPRVGVIDVADEVSGLEDRYGTRIGVVAVDTGTGREVSYRGDERVGYASTLKAFAAAAFLAEVPAAEREQVVTWSSEDVAASGYSPVTSEHIDGGLPLLRLAEVAVRESDNTAMNLVLRRIGGPRALDAVLEGLGDDVTQVVGTEPSLNLIEPGSTDDTTTPAAFTAAFDALLVGDLLTADDRATLLGWMSGNATGDALVRAGAPEGWVVADKSGGAGGIRNDLAVVTPPGRAPIVLTVLTVKDDPAAEYDDAAVAETARLVLAALG